MEKFYHLLLVIIGISCINCQQSCNDITQFYSDFNGVYGKVQVAHVPKRHVTLIEIRLSIGARLANGNSWKISAANKDVYSDIINDRGLEIRFEPVPTNPYPIVTGVFLNGNQICSDPPAQGNFISTIKLSYTYTLNDYSQYYPASVPPQVTDTYPQTDAPVVYHPQPTAPPRPAIVNKFSENTYRRPALCGIRRTKGVAVSYVINAQAHEFPWLVALYYESAGFICGGTIVSQRVVVTAAHCVQNKQDITVRRASESQIYLGKYSLNDSNDRESIVSGVEKFEVHPSWNAFSERYDGDISVAILSQTIEFSNNIIPLCIWRHTKDHQDLTGLSGVVAGWGITEKGTPADAPNFVTLPVVGDIECLRSGPEFSVITSDSNFCVGDKSGKSPCNGDSGGAFAVEDRKDHKYYFRGIVSAGIYNQKRQCDSYNYAVFTDVAKFTGWIDSFIKLYG